MLNFIIELKTRNEALFYFGWVCYGCAVVFWALSLVNNVQVYGVSAWYKPFKFAVSIGMYAWTMGWYCAYLQGFNVAYFNWAVVLLLGFELLYIAIQAARGQQSHFNVTTPLYGMLYVAMGIAAALVTVYTAYVGYLFFKQSFPNLPHYYVWAIRLGLIVFVVFSFEGFAMGSRLSHTVGAVNDNSKLYILGWSQKVGDLRIAHFIGMHALQILPLLSYYLLKNTKLTMLFACIYMLLAAYTFAMALNGKPLVNTPQSKILK